MAAECPRCFATAHGDHCPVCGLAFGAPPDSEQWRQHEELQAAWLSDASHHAQAQNYERVARHLASQGLPQPQPLELRRLGEVAQRSPAGSASHQGPAGPVGSLAVGESGEGFQPDADYLLGAGYWTTFLALLVPALVLVAWVMGVLVILRGRLGGGLFLLFVSSLIAGAGAAIWANFIL